MAVDILNRKFGRLTIVERVKSRKDNRLCLCRCDCGNEKIFWTANVISGRTQSCGCLNSEIITKRNFKHGHGGHGKARSREYQAWSNMLTRCTNPNSTAWHNYGGRGIAVSDELADFSRFLAVLGPCPDGYELDRINNDGHYERGNVRWADLKTQANNKRCSRPVVFNGKCQTLAEWSIETGIGEGTIRYRLHHGWTIDQALTTPVQR